MKQLREDFSLDFIRRNFTIIHYHPLINVILSYWSITTFLCITFFSSLVQNSAKIRNLKQMGKKSTAASAPIATVKPAKDLGPSKKGLTSDTTCLGLGNTSWESIYNLIEAEEPKEI